MKRAAELPNAVETDTQAHADTLYTLLLSDGHEDRRIPGTLHGPRLVVVQLFGSDLCLDTGDRPVHRSLFLIVVRNFICQGPHARFIFAARVNAPKLWRSAGRLRREEQGGVLLDDMST